MVLNHRGQLATHISETTAIGEVPSCNENLQKWYQFKEPIRLLLAIALSMLMIMVTMSSRLRLNFPKIYSASNVSNKRMGSV